MTNRIPFIAGNWKMNLDHQQGIALVQKLAWTLKDANFDYSKAEVAVFPGFTSLRSIQTLIDADQLEVKLGAQDLSAQDSGAFTGEVSGVALKKLDIEYVLIGHSERRQYHNEDDSVVRGKTAAAFRHGIVPVICVGETLEELEAEGAAAVPVRQTLAALADHDSLGDFVIAYEPVWAIGTGLTASTEQAEEMHAAIRSWLAARYSQDVAEQISILYGGSCNPGNAKALFACPNVDGGLIGGASLKIADFSVLVAEETWTI